MIKLQLLGLSLRRLSRKREETFSAKSECVVFDGLVRE